LNTFIPCRTKFLKLRSLLMLGLHTIVDQHRGGELEELTSDEVRSLIRSLFADTPVRSQALARIRAEPS
jgi:hypothetical protein